MMALFFVTPRGLVPNRVQATESTMLDLPAPVAPRMVVTPVSAGLNMKCLWWRMLDSSTLLRLMLMRGSLNAYSMCGGMFMLPTRTQGHPKLPVNSL